MSKGAQFTPARLVGSRLVLHLSVKLGTVRIGRADLGNQLPKELSDRGRKMIIVLSFDDENRLVEAASECDPSAAADTISAISTGTVTPLSTNTSGNSCRRHLNSWLLFTSCAAPRSTPTPRVPASPPPSGASTLQNTGDEVSKPLVTLVLLDSPLLTECLR
jgi:hypothetical protein